jgi:hypothetical protein
MRNCITARIPDGSTAPAFIVRASAHLRGSGGPESSENGAGGDENADAARVRALAAFKGFLTLWKDADPGIPILNGHFQC